MFANILLTVRQNTDTRQIDNYLNHVYNVHILIQKKVYVSTLIDLTSLLSVIPLIYTAYITLHKNLSVE